MPSSRLHVQVGALVAIGATAAVVSVVPRFQAIAIGSLLLVLGRLAWLTVRESRNESTGRVGTGQSRPPNGAHEAARAPGEDVSRELLRSIIDSAVDGIIVIDHRGRVESFNPAAERLFGYPRSEVIGRNVTLLMPSPYREEHDGYLNRYLTTGEARIIGIGREVTGRRRDGSMFPLHLSVGELTVEGERKFTGIVHDLTGRVRLEEQLRERASLATVGEMAAVIAHEVKNPLAGVRGAIEIIRGRLPAGGQDASVLSDIVKRIDALDGLMKDVLLFARPPQPRLSAVDVVPLVTMTADLICQDPSLSGIRVSIQGSSPPVFADAEMLKIVFQNLLVNGAHAMEGRGKIDVTIGARNGTCQIAFTDYGPGIAEEIRDKIFTAFFTTKSRGSGLGLATAKRLIEAHQGEIQVECPPGGGTTVSLRIPTAARQADTGPPGV